MTGPDCAFLLSFVEFCISYLLSSPILLEALSYFQTDDTLLMDSILFCSILLVVSEKLLPFDDELYKSLRYITDAHSAFFVFALLEQSSTNRTGLLFIFQGVCFLHGHVFACVIDTGYFHSVYFYVSCLLGWTGRFVKADLRAATLPPPWVVYTNPQTASEQRGH